MGRLRDLTLGRIASDAGATAVEYALMITGIAMLIVLVVFAVGGNLNVLFTGFATAAGKWLGS